MNTNQQIDIAKLLLAEGDECSFDALVASISTVRRALNSKVEYLSNNVSSSDVEQVKEWMVAIRCDTYIIDTLVEKLSNISMPKSD